MDENKFASVLPIIIGGLTDKIVNQAHLTEDQALHSLYSSKLYAMLEKEETKVWTYSVPKLFELYEAEKSSGKLELPEY